MNHNFTVEEVNLICIFAGEGRSEVIEDIERALQYLDDLDMEELSHRIIGKLRNMTDEEFEQLELTEAELLSHLKCGRESLFFMSVSGFCQYGKSGSLIADFDGQQYNIVQEWRKCYAKEKPSTWALLQNMR